MKKKTLHLSAGLIGLGACWPVWAGGFQLNEQDVVTQGTSFAGRASTPTNAATVFNNPAGMSFLDQAQLTVGTVYLNLSSDITTRDSGQPLTGLPVSGESDGDMIPGEAIPFGYVVVPLDKRWTFGFGVYVPFGLITDYSDDFQGRYFGDYSRVEVVTAQPTLSYRFNDQWSLGLGVTYNWIDGKLGAATANPLDPTNEGDVKVEGDDQAWGYNIGLMYQPTKATTLGLAYRSKVDYSLEGHTTYNNTLDSATFNVVSARSDAKLDITLPESVELSLTQKLDPRWTVMASATWTHWSRFDELYVENSNPRVNDIQEPENWDDTWMYAVGASYQLDPAWVVRAGVAYDESPMDGATRTVRVPTGDRWIYSLGAGWQPTDTLTFDVSYSYFNEESVSVSQSNPQRGTYDAGYDSDGHGFGAQVTWRF
ncbi:OmpP1/FadL family transporter [Larsenimonas suaedae]|uniref:TonB-dependent receptor n=1 Tax=Larsenimonas suaedae TaxID=1851019 RepID=A0ABU1GWZ6_9GAMM|nr:outer membrane protein transport protein [Larsenimonas suaedae]MCM2973135.1 outer membrane protein transport protein [Larsenimonas suaedae]MDR5896572.1 TonB-dependent receptor [Larsenimonas suaedae]